MKKIFLIAISLLAVSLVAIYCTDYDFNNPFDSRNLPSGTTYATFTDSRDGQNYRIVIIGAQTWMADNLNFEPDNGNSWCYDDEPTYCNVYGRLYDWNTAMTVCPDGWHLPSNAEWLTLVDYVGGTLTAGTKLKSTTGWMPDEITFGLANNEFGFSALPGGGRYGDGISRSVGYSGNWWTTVEEYHATDTEDNATSARNWSMDHNYEGIRSGISSKAIGMSVRCVKSD